MAEARNSDASLFLFSITKVRGTAVPYPYANAKARNDRITLMCLSSANVACSTKIEVESLRAMPPARYANDYASGYKAGNDSKEVAHLYLPLQPVCGKVDI